MDIESLKLFADVQKSGNITNAANNRYITQSTVSKRIALMEKELGITLFQRGRGQARVALTPAGEAFSDIAERMLLLYEQAMELQKDAQRQTLTIACVNSVQGYTLPPLILSLEQRYPDLCFTLEDHHSTEIFSLLEKRCVDIGISQAPAPFCDLQSVLLYEEAYRVVMREPAGKRPGRRTIHPSQLPAEHEIYEAFGSELETWHNYWWRPLSAKIRVNTTPTAERYFHAPEDWMIVPASVAWDMEGKGFVSYGLEEEPPTHRVFVIYGKRNSNAAVKLFADAARAYFTEHRPWERGR